MRPQFPAQALGIGTMQTRTRHSLLSPMSGLPKRFAPAPSGVKRDVRT